MFIFEKRTAPQAPYVCAVKDVIFESDFSQKSKLYIGFWIQYYYCAD